MSNKDQKVFFVQNAGNGQYETESIWCDKVGDDFVVDNIPFIARNISLGDTVKAEYDKEDGVYYFEDFEAESGNTTLRIRFEDVGEIENIRQLLNDNYGCETEVLLQRKLVAVNVPKDIQYRPIKDFLDNGEKEGKWAYEESCLAHTL